jgi:hypothetical protein
VYEEVERGLGILIYVLLMFSATTIALDAENLAVLTGVSLRTSNVIFPHAQAISSYLYSYTLK